MARDQHKIRQRLEEQINLLLTDMEENPQLWSSKERLHVVQIVGGYLMRQIRFGDEYVPTGAAVRRYSGAFKTTNVAGSRARGAGPPILVSDDDDTAA